MNGVAMNVGVQISVYMPASNPYFLFFFLIVTILTGMSWYLMSLACISLMISNVEHLGMCLLIIWIFSLEKCPLPIFECLLFY